MRRMTKTAALLSAAALLLSACGGNDTESGNGGEGKRRSQTSRSAWRTTSAAVVTSPSTTRLPRGMDKATEEFGMESQESEAADGEPESAREERLRTFADAGYNPIIAVGFAYAARARRRSPRSTPTPTSRSSTTRSPQADNIANLVFAEEQGSFLVGAAAALKTKTDHIGFIGGVEVPLIQKFEAGYVAGAKAVNPKIKVDVNYLTQAPDFSGFGDPAKGKTAAQGMYDAGADIVYHAAGGSGGGVFEAASESGKLAIGVDSDQYKTADPSVKDVIMTSMLKNVDVAVYDYLTEVNDGNFPSGMHALRPCRGRRRLLHQRWLRRRHHEQARRVQAADHRRRDHGPDVLI